MKTKPRSRVGQYLSLIVAISTVPRVLLAQAPAQGGATPPGAPPNAAAAGAAPKPAAPNAGAAAPKGATPNAGAAPKAAAPSAVDAAEGKRHFDTGLRLFKEGVYDAALVEFQQSYKLGRRPTALRNVAQAHRELKQFVEAHETFERLLEVHGAQLKDAEKKDIQRALNDLALVTATVDVKVNEAGAEILVDGKAVAQSPATKKVRVAVGTRKVRAQKAGFDPDEKEMLLVGQQDATVELTLKPEVLAGHLIVRERTNQVVKVAVDDKEVGSTPWEGDLPPGVHTVEAKAQNMAAPRQTIEIVNKGRAELVLDAVSTAARVRVNAAPSVAVITLDGQKVATGTFDGDVPEGEHKLEVSAPGHQTYTRQIKAVGGQSLTQDVTLVSVQPAVAVQAQEPPSYSGGYGNLFLAGQFGVSGDDFLWQCAQVVNQTCDKSPPLGAGLGLRLGYNIEYIGIEGVAMFAGTYAKQTLRGTGLPAQSGALIDETSSAQRQDDVNIIGYHPFLGGGVRGNSHGQTVRVTGGVAAGLAMRNYVIARTLGNGVTTTPLSDKASSSSFGLLLDAGIQIGGTPGTKLTLGVLAWIDFNKDVRTQGGGPTAGTASGGLVNVTQPQYRLTNGTQVYVGPTLGVQFGH